MQRELWKHEYPSLPSFDCPRCGVGRLSIRKDDDGTWKTPHHLHAGLRDEDLHNISAGRFHAYMTCQHGPCGEVVSVIGNYSEENHYLGNDVYGEPMVEDDTSLMVKAIIPAPHIIKVSPALSEVAADHLKVSFKLFWVDIGSCANRIRIVVETALDQLGVPRQKPRQNGSLHDLKLVDRINELGILKPGHEEALHALREVGNVGSHEGDAAIEDVLDCYELLEATIEELLEDKKAKLAAKAASIRARKGRPAP